MKKIVLLTLTLCIVASFAYFAQFNTVLAQSTPDDNTPTEEGSGGIKLPPKPPGIPDVSVSSLVSTVIRIMFAVGQVAFVIVLLSGGVMFITSSGNEQQVEKAKKAITFAIVGIIVLFSAWGIASFIVQQLNR
jgi:amino acid transporter